MTTLSIKDVPAEWAEQLRQRAMRNHRSLQGELMAIVEQAIASAPLPEAPALTRMANGASLLDTSFQPVMRRGTRSVEQIFADHLRQFPEPISQGPLAVDIVRQDRDSR